MVPTKLQVQPSPVHDPQSARERRDESRFQHLHSSLCTLKVVLDVMQAEGLWYIGKATLACKAHDFRPGVILGLYRGYIGIMEKKMETTIIGYILGLLSVVAAVVALCPRVQQARGGSAAAEK